MAERVGIFEVGPRDGLQNEKGVIETAQKVAFVDALSAAGLSRIEVASFVSPKWVPQMADGAQVLSAITRAPGISYTALVPNMKGLAGAEAAQVDEIAVFASASEGFSQANLNATMFDALDRFRPVVAAATMPVRGYVSCVTDCPYDGQVAPQAVVDVALALWQMGCVEISLGDTLGRGAPARIGAMLDAVLEVIPANILAGHFHDTSGAALANVDVALERGLRVFDGAAGGLGGCPYAPGAAGNVATEDLVAHVEALWFETGIDRDALAKAARMAKGLR